jgi:hypothetical protein
METALSVVIALAVTCGFLWWLQSRHSPTGAPTDEIEKLRGEKEQLARDFAMLKANLEQKIEETGQLKATLDSERNEHNEKSGKGKQLFIDHTKLESRYESLQKEHDALKKLLTRHEADQKRQEKEFDEKLAKLEAAKLSLDQERERVIRSEQDRLREEEEERDRLWNDHENTVIATLTDLCKQPTYSFTSYSNTNLPEGFDGSLKPDFMIDFLGQYVIFDAKVSKAKSLRAYMTEQLKKTVDKVKDNDRIYKSIFLVVPTAALAELKQHHHIVEGFSIYIISMEALPAILASLKKITLYEFAEQMDPQQRENIVQLIAELDFHINLRNAADLILTKMGTDLLQKAQRVDPTLAEEVTLKKLPMNAKASIAAAELKRIVTKLTTQVEEVQELVSPKAPVRKRELKNAESLISESLFE